MSTASAPVTTWDGCYDDGWKGLIVAEAFAHPAKFARGLIRRIYQYLLTSGRLAAGDTVVDPFGGVGLGGLDAMTSGLHWIGCELEPRFAALGLQNIALWESWIGEGRLPGPKGSARLLCGDSRQLAEVLAPALAAAVVSSPPYAETIDTRNGPSGLNVQKRADGRPMGYGRSEVQANAEGYGATPGQLGAMPAGDPPGVDGVVSSPPFEKQMASHAGFIAPHDTAGRMATNYEDAYGDTAGQLGNEDGETFWAAFRTILGQCHALLKPAGVLVLVCKDFVRDKARVPFSADTIKLAEVCGFRFVEWIRASLVKSTAEASLFGGVIVETTERKSFFRRLAERKGSPRIDHEDILVFTKGPA